MRRLHTDNVAPRCLLNTNHAWIGSGRYSRHRRECLRIVERSARISSGIGKGFGLLSFGAPDVIPVHVSRDAVKFVSAACQDFPFGKCHRNTYMSSVPGSQSKNRKFHSVPVYAIVKLGRTASRCLALTTDTPFLSTNLRGGGAC